MTKSQTDVFDAFIEFLRSDIWQIPVNEFIEQRSLVFDRDPKLGEAPDTTGTYQSVHREFKRMVNDLLGAYCSDGGLTREQLMDAIKAADQAQKLTQRDRLLLEPIVAAQDFDVFVPMMMRKNIELQLQALKMIEHLNGLLPSSFKLDQEDAEMWNALFEEDESDRFILISVLKQSRLEWEQDQKMREDWQTQMEAAMKESMREKSLLEEMRQREHSLMEQAMSKANNAFMNLNLSSEEGPPASAEGAAVDPKHVRFDATSTKVPPNSAASVAPKILQKVETAAITTPSKEMLPIVEKAVEKSATKSPKKEKKESAKLNGNKPSELNALDIPEKQKVRRSVSRGENQMEEEANKNGKGTEKGGKRLSLGQVHTPPQRMFAEKTETNKGDLAYRNLLKERESVPETEVQKRMRYLREQRDKLLQKKSREREKQLFEATKMINESRPRTAQAARGAMEQNGASTELEERRRIAAKIRAQVIDKTSE